MSFHKNSQFKLEKFRQQSGPIVEYRLANILKLNCAISLNISFHKHFNNYHNFHLQ